MLAGHLAWLFNQHQFALRLCISKAPESSWIPPPDMLLALQDYICKFDMYSVSAQHPASSNITAPVSLHHLSALTHRSMSVLTCLVEVPLLVSIDEDAPADGSTSNSAISPVANMTGLTQLHLNAICDDLHLDFRTLGQLSLLQDLALQCFDFDVCCGAVLRSSRQSLRSIILTAMSWTAETYQRLHDVPFQQHLSISIAALDHAQALLLNGIQADVLKLVVHGNYGDDLPLVGLRLSLPQVHDLTLYRFSDVDPIDGLPLLPSLQRLTIVECHELTGRSVLTYPNVTQLTLVDCPSVSGAGLQHIVRIALPALKAISFHASEGQCSAMTPKLSLHALNALHFGQDLQLIDLRGVSELTYECVAKLQRACERKQRVRQSRVLLLLPSCIDQGEAELLLELEDHFILPNIIVSRLQCPLPLTDMIAESDTLSDMHHVLMM